jgi:hypothetical protein
MDAEMSGSIIEPDWEWIWLEKLAVQFLASSTIPVDQ